MGFCQCPNTGTTPQLSPTGELPVLYPSQAAGGALDGDSSPAGRDVQCLHSLTAPGSQEEAVPLELFGKKKRRKMEKFLV